MSASERPVGTSKAPDGARVIDAGGKTVTPGLFDSAVQIGIVEIPLAGEGTADQNTTDARVSAAFNVIDAFNPRSAVIPVTRVEGITRAPITPGGTGKRQALTRCRPQTTLDVYETHKSCAER